MYGQRYHPKASPYDYQYQNNGVIAAYAFQTNSQNANLGNQYQPPIAYEKKYEYIDIPPARHSGYKNEDFEPWLNSKLLRETESSLDSSFFMTVGAYEKGMKRKHGTTSTFNTFVNIICRLF